MHACADGLNATVGTCRLIETDKKEARSEISVQKQHVGGLLCMEACFVLLYAFTFGLMETR